MILTVDIGNTDTKLGVFSLDGKLTSELRFPSRLPFDIQFYTTQLHSLLQHKFRKIVIASVVPALTSGFMEMLQPKTEKLHIVSADSPWGFSIETENPAATGHDRLANIEGALRHGGFAIVVDAGTATKFDVLEGVEKKRFPGGAIAPGLGISFEALLARAAQLPRIELEKHSPVLGYNTETAIRSGVVFGFAALVDGMVMRLFEERKLPMQTAVIATGGYAHLLHGRAKLITRYVPKLTLEGLYGIAEKI